MSHQDAEFDPVSASLSGQSLIEASAGTGKTYNIVRLFARLLLEPDATGRVRRVAEILTVTFTRAATEELRDRIRRLLEELLEAAGDTEPASSAAADFAEALFSRVGRSVARGRLLQALADFDEAPIFTIHGFCRRALGEFAFEARESFQGEVIPALPGMLREVAADFWRSSAYPALPAVVAFCLSKKFVPDNLLPLLRVAISRPEAELPHVAGRSDLPAIVRYEEAHARAISAWKRNRAEVMALLADGAAAGGLNRGFYSGDGLLRLRSAMDVFAALGSPAPGEFDAILERLLPEVLSAKTNKGHPTPRHEFFALWQELHSAAETLKGELTEFLNHLTAEFVRFGREETPKRADALGVLTYNDLPTRLDNALRDPARGPALRVGLRRRYTCALVDEFQDTDPVQWRIFRDVFRGPGLSLFLIGDPKQSIYGFRGADLDVYLAAARASESRYTLRVNYRSTPRLLAAFNVLFSRPNPFRRSAIVYHSVRSPEESAAPELFVDGRSIVPLEILFPAGPDGSPISLNRGQAKDRAREGTINRIIELLEASREGRAMLGSRAVRPADVAVLVRTNREAEDMKRALERAGVRSVLRVDRSLFQSAEAEELYRILRAIENPSRGDFLREALVTEMLGRDAEGLFALEESETLLSDLMVEFRDYRDLWMRRGFMHMFQELLAHEKIPERLLAYPEGERRMTNLMHLAEVLHREGRHGRGAELRVLRGDDAGSVPEEHLIRLESDEEAVQVVTSHLSKGLQYGIVFVPFSWSLRPMAGDGLQCGRLPDDDATVLLPSFLGGSDAEALRRKLESAAATQTMEEELRLLYVAVTRARSYCALVWGSIHGSLDTAPAHIFHDRSGPTPAFTSSSKRDAGVPPEQLLVDLTELVQAGAGAITAGPLSPGSGLHLRPESETRQVIAPAERSFERELEAPFHIRSFTSLTMENRVEPESPAHAEAPSVPEPRVESRVKDAFSFPRGGRTGVFFHLVLEKYFRGERSDLQALVQRTALSFGLGDWADVALKIVERTLSLQIPAIKNSLRAVSLGDLPTEDCLTELQFYYPEEAGFMTGFADLVFFARGQYYLLDWKSNFLGPSLADYAPERLETVMRAEAYDLQYSIYAHALDRYLRLRDRAYSYSKSFGGVYYIFLRGLEDGPRGQTGVFFARPTEEEVRGFQAGRTSSKAPYG